MERSIDRWFTVIKVVRDRTLILDNTINLKLREGVVSLQEREEPDSKDRETFKIVFQMKKNAAIT